MIQYTGQGLLILSFLLAVTTLAVAVIGFVISIVYELDKTADKWFKVVGVLTIVTASTFILGALAAPIGYIFKI